MRAGRGREIGQQPPPWPVAGDGAPRCEIRGEVVALQRFLELAAEIHLPIGGGTYDRVSSCRVGERWDICQRRSPNIFRSERNINHIRARILCQSKANEYRIIDSKVGDDHRSKAENRFAHAL